MAIGEITRFRKRSLTLQLLTLQVVGKGLLVVEIGRTAKDWQCADFSERAGLGLEERTHECRCKLILIKLMGGEGGGGIWMGIDYHWPNTSLKLAMSLDLECPCRSSCSRLSILAI